MGGPMGVRRSPIAEISKKEALHGPTAYQQQTAHQLGQTVGPALTRRMLDYWEVGLQAAQEDLI
jgi:hypothetical protein